MSEVVIRIDMRPPLEAVGRVKLAAREGRSIHRMMAREALERSAQAYDREADPVTGRPWAALKPSTRVRKAKRCTTLRKLVCSGRLRGSMKQGGAGNIVQVTRRYARVGTSVPYGIFHQHGTRKMRRRRFLGVSRVAIREMRSEAERMLAAAWRGKATR